MIRQLLLIIICYVEYSLTILRVRYTFLGELYNMISVMKFRVSIDTAGGLYIF